MDLQKRDQLEIQSVALSSRGRVMRNLKGFPFPNSCSSTQLIEVMQATIAGAKKALPDLVSRTDLTIDEREQLLARRLISPNFSWNEPGRALLLAASAEHELQLSIMINEEDHLRIQLFSEGLELNPDALNHVVDSLGRQLEFSFSDSDGYLAASVYNCGPGTRYSSMLHLIGLQIEGSLPRVLESLVESRVTFRGAFGEGTKPIGAFLQMSDTSSRWEPFAQLCRFVVEKELEARQKLGINPLRQILLRGGHSILETQQLDFASSVRVLSVIRAMIGFIEDSQRKKELYSEVQIAIDHTIPTGMHSEQEQAKNRAAMIQKLVQQIEIVERCSKN